MQISRAIPLIKHPRSWMHVSANIGYISIDDTIFREVDDYNRLMIEISKDWKTTIYIGFKKFKNWDNSIKGVIKCSSLIPSDNEIDRLIKVCDNDPEVM